ncbi:MAG: MscL family protein [Candidatus Bathyarchaeia archaeon]
MPEEINREILEELRRIREAVSPKPPPAPKGLREEITAFLREYSITGLAIAFIIGGAARSLVSALVGDLLMPVITFFIPGGAWRTGYVEHRSDSVGYWRSRR